MEKSNLQELHQEAFLADADQVADFLGRALAKLDAIDPFGDENAARTIFVLHLWHVNVLDVFAGEQILQSLLVGRFVQEIELSVKAYRPFIE